WHRLSGLDHPPGLPAGAPPGGGGLAGAAAPGGSDAAPPGDDRRQRWPGGLPLALAAAGAAAPVAELVPGPPPHSLQPPAAPGAAATLPLARRVCALGGEQGALSLSRAPARPAPGAATRLVCHVSARARAADPAGAILGGGCAPAHQRRRPGSRPGRPPG